MAEIYKKIRAEKQNSGRVLSVSEAKLLLITEKSQSLKEQITLRAQEKPSTTLGTKGGTILSKNRNSQLSRIPSLSQVNEATNN